MNKLSLKYLKKTTNARQKNIETYELICNDNVKKNKKNTNIWLNLKKLIPRKKKDIKVLEGLIKNELKVVIKIQKIHYNDILIKRNIEKENKWNKKLQKFQNFITSICNFNCNDDIIEYEKNINKKLQLCVCSGEGKDLINVSILKFINGDTIEKFLLKMKYSINHWNIINSLVYQILLGYLEAHKKTNFLHMDLKSSGNIMIIVIDNEYAIYKINNKIFKVKTFRFKPIILDFGMSQEAYVEKQISFDLQAIYELFPANLQDKRLNIEKQFSKIFFMNSISDILEYISKNHIGKSNIIF